MKEIYIIRHGETNFNKEGIVQGKGIDADLNDTGERQAEAFWEYYKDVPFDKVYTSTLKRTWQTVNKFIKAGIDWEKLSGLDELDWGIWEGRKKNEELIGAFRSMLQSWESGDYTNHFEHGESVQDVFDRLEKPKHLLEKRTKEKKVLVCMHGRSMRVFLCLLTGAPLSKMSDFPHQNTVLYRLSYEDGKFNIIDFSDTRHLEILK
ncbi:broad specificity phosphatase PhoE [Pedobacter sp. UYP30]|uniref:histidine phosphatase family protein n=1 Tax=Pedobacter sp. UYP30 TaxID=1756400 RepID=UPI003391A6B2